MTSPVAALGRARMLISAERWTDAMTILGACVASHPDEPDALGLMAQCRLGLGDPSSAHAAARQLLALETDSEWGHRLLSVALREQRRFTDARNAAREAVRLVPESWMAHRELAEVDIAANNVTSATWEAARRAVELAPHAAAAHGTLGRVGLGAGDNKAAEAAFREVLRLEPDNSAARNNLAVVQLRRRRMLSAGSHLVGALRLNPTSDLFAHNLRVVFRIWASVLNVLGILACVVVLNTTAGTHVLGTRSTIVRLPDPAAVSVAPGGGVTPVIDANGDVLISGVPVVADEPTDHVVPDAGRPAVLWIAAAVLVAGLVCILLVLRRALGPNAVRIVRAAMRRDAALAITAGLAALGVTGMACAVAVGLPFARGAVGATLAADVFITVIIRVITGRPL